MMDEVYDLSYCSSGLSLKSELLLSPKDHYGFVPNLIHHGGKNTALRAQKQKFVFQVRRTVVFASEDVFSCVATSDDGGACARTCSQHKTKTVAR